MKIKELKSPSQKPVTFSRRTVLALKKVKFKAFFNKHLGLVISIIALIATLITTFLALKNYNTEFPNIQLDRWGIVEYETTEDIATHRLKSITTQVMISNTGGSSVSLIEFDSEVVADDKSIDTEPVTLEIDLSLRAGLQALLDSQRNGQVLIGSEYYSIQQMYPTPEISLLSAATTTPAANVESLPIVIGPGESKIIALVWKLDLPTKNSHLTKMNIILKFNDKSFLVIPVLEAFSKS